MSDHPKSRPPEAPTDPPPTGEAVFSIHMQDGRRTPPHDFPFLSPPRVDGELGWIAHYRVRKLIGSGGMGFVFEADDTHLHRPVAVKVMKPDLAAQLKAHDRFLSEARAAAGLRSDFVIAVYQVGEANGLPYLAMELLSGQTLHDRMKQFHRLTIEQTVRIGMEAARGLAAAHDAGLVHRDIKPANIWLEADPAGVDFRRVRVLDFGLARAFDQGPGLTTAGTVVGTPHFMAPEQADGRQVDGRADIFSLGCVIYTMLTGEMPFRGSGTMQVMMALANHDPPPPRTQNPACPPALESLVMRMMAKVPQDRPPTAASVAEILAYIYRTLSDSRETPAPAGSFGRGSNPVVRLTPQSIETLHFGTGSGGEPLSTPPMPTPPRLKSGNAPPVETGGKTRRGLWIGAAIIAVCTATAALLWPRDPAPNAVVPPAVAEPIIVGVLHSATGPSANVGAPVTDATLLAIDEVNAAGGVLGRPVKAVVIDGKSDPHTFAAAAERLLTTEKAAAIFGCGSSITRRAARPVVERFHGVLFFPVFNEGLEESPRIVYLGPTANQQLLPALDFLIAQGKKRLFLIGSDAVYPRATAAIARDYLASRPGEKVEFASEFFLPVGTRNVDAAVAAIQAARPDAVVNAVSGVTIAPLFRALASAGPPTSDLPTLSLCLMEPDLERIDPKAAVGHYVIGGYFLSEKSPAWQEFTARVRKQYGADRAVSDPMAAAYASVHLWADAAKVAGSVAPDDVLRAVAGRTLSAPWGQIRIDPETRYAWLPAQVGKIDQGANGRLHITSAFGSAEPIRPVPYPQTRPRADWDRLLAELRDNWDGNWSAPFADR